MSSFTGTWNQTFLAYSDVPPNIMQIISSIS